MRTVGEVGYCAIRRNYAVVEYDTYDAMKRAVRKLDDTKLRSGGESRYIRVYNCYRHHSSLVHAVTHHRVLVRRVTHRVPAVILHVPRAVRRLLNVILHLHLILILDDVFVLINQI